jgi:hypothetical protein
MHENYSLSFWERESFLRHADVAIIGSGIVGLVAALHFKKKQPGLRVIILDRGVLPLGASTRNAGFACFGSVSELLDDLSRQSEDEVFELVERRWRGLQRLREIAGDEAIEFSLSGNYEIFRKEEEATFGQCRDHVQAFNQKLRPLTGKAETYRLVDEKIADFGFGQVSHLILNQAEGQLHTGKMMRRLLQLAREAGIDIFSGVEITHFAEDSEQVELFTRQGWTVKARHLLVATNGFARHLLPELPVQPARNQVLITQPIAGLRVRGCFHYDRGYFYFRHVGDRVLLGGGRNLSPTEEHTDQLGHTKFIQDTLLHMLRTVVLPGQPFEVDTWWSGILGIGEQKKPIVKWVSQRVAAAVRMGGMGVALGSLAGEEGAELILSRLR